MVIKVSYDFIILSQTLHHQKDTNLAETPLTSLELATTVQLKQGDHGEAPHKTYRD